MIVANCGSEASTVWSSIQPHGALLVLKRESRQWWVVRASANASELLGLSGILGQAVTACFAQSAGPFLQKLTTLDAGQFQMGELASLARGPLYATAHRPLARDRGNSGTIRILEIEPLASDRRDATTSDRAGLHASLTHLRQATGPDALLRAATAELQQLTGYERALAYRFDATGAGVVVAESLGSTASESYLGLHYPASDIPDEARITYQHCFLRYIPDFSATPIPVVAADGVEPAATPLAAADVASLRLSLLRYPSPCCVEYHHNMGVEALLVLPLLQAGELWGLLACHHSTPHFLAPSVRADCELLGKFVALELTNQQARSDRAYEEYLQTLRTEAIAALARSKDLQGTLALLAADPHLLALTDATGAAVCLDGKISLVGAAPPPDTVRTLLTWAESYLGKDENLLATSTLAALYPAANDFADTASGLLLLQISRARRWIILWFRPEIPRTITWAGNPTAPFRTDASEAARPLGPRASFARWQEISRGTAKPWQPAELRSARALRGAIVGFVLQRVDDLERSNAELTSFAFAASHDLKEPLRGIHNYAAFLLEDYADRLDATGSDRLQTLMRLAQRMESLIDVLLRYSRLGQASLNAELTDLDALVKREIELFKLNYPQDELEFRQPRPLPTLPCDPVLVRELFNNLIGNACKYNDKARRWVEIGYLTPAEQIQQFPQRTSPAAALLYVRDNGIGIRDRHKETIFRLFKRLHARDRYGGGTGAGLAIAKRIVERHNGQIWVDSTYGSGSTFYFSLRAHTS